MQEAIDLICSSEDIKAIYEFAKGRKEIELVSEPSNLEATHALSVGIAEVMTGLAFITLVFKTGTAALDFLKAFREELKNYKKGVTIADPKTGINLGNLDSNSQNREIENILKK